MFLGGVLGAIGKLSMRREYRLGFGHILYFYFGCGIGIGHTSIY